MECNWSDVLGKKSRRWLKTFPLRSCYHQELDGYVRVAQVLTILIAEVTTTIKELVSTNAQAQLLMTVPVISYYSALLILSEIGEVGRLPSAKHLYSYPAWFLVCIARGVNHFMAGSPSKAPAG